MQMGSVLNLPSNVEVKTFILDADVAGSSNVTVPNPFGRTDMNRIIGINFSASPESATAIAFIVNPGYGIGDNVYNRKCVNVNDYIMQTNYYAIVSITDESIVLRNSGNYNFAAGTYYLFAW